MMRLSKLFGVAVLGFATLAGCGDNSPVSDFRYAMNELMPDPDVDMALNLMAMGSMRRAMRFKGTQVSASSGFAYDNADDAPVVTFDVINRNLCHHNITDDDRKLTVCNQQSSLSERQRIVLQKNICQGARVSGNRAYKQLFCGPPKLT